MSNLWEAAAIPHNSSILVITLIITPGINHFLMKVIKIGLSSTPSMITISKILAT